MTSTLLRATVPLLLLAAIPALGKDVVIIQKGKAFLDESGKPLKSIDVGIKDTLKFENEDDITHNVYSISKGNEFELKIQKPGQISEVALDGKKHKPGKMDVECAIHPSMKLTVNIKAKAK